MTSGKHARIAAVGSYLPERSVGNAHFEETLKTSDEWIRTRTGIERRRFAGPQESTATLGTEAGRRALASSQTDSRGVDLLICGTCTPDHLLPATAGYIQAALGLACPSFDLNAGCAGFVYSLSVAAAHVRSGMADRVLVVCSDTLSKFLNYEDRSTCVLFGDGAGAVLVEASADEGVMGSVLALDGNAADLLVIPAGGSAEPTTAESIATRRDKVHMADGPTVFKRAVTGMADACSELLTKMGVSAEDLDLVVPHQANQRIMTAVADRLGIDKDKLLVDIAEVGNTSGASIPIAMDRARRSGILRNGDLVLTTAFGSGLAWGANLLRWTVPDE